ncbi:hypothetical protein AOLI_G00208430 [Acnodon oligacanthus]
MSGRSRGQEGIMCGGRRVASLLFSDDVLLVGSHGCLQHSLEWFAAECEAVGMRVSASKSESMVLAGKRIACSLQVRGKDLSQMEEFKYLGVLFTSDGKRDREIGRRLGQATAVMRSLYWTVVVKRELSQKVKLSVYRSFYILTLTYGHELWDELRIELLLLRIERSQLRWFGHLIRMHPGRLPVGVYQAQPIRTRPRGHPRVRWRDYISKMA